MPMQMPENFLIFSSIASAIFLEAMPFLALGSLVSALIEVWVSVEKLGRLIPKSFIGGTAFGIAGGLVVPTCECGVVPIARRLILKGAPSHVAITYMLAAPIINPLVLASTYVAFRGSLTMVAGRVAIAAIVAGAMALFVRKYGGEHVLKSPTDDHCMSREHDHSCEHVHSCDHDVVSPLWGKVLRTLSHAGADFLEMGKYLIVGAIAAAFFKTYLPQEVFTYFSASPVLSVVGMMMLAVLLSVCSEADAFVAASFVSFPQAAQLAFVTIGPMVDLKLIGMYATVFNQRLFWALLIVPTVVVFLLTMALGILL